MRHRSIGNQKPEWVGKTARQNQCWSMLSVGFEPTRPQPCELESHPLDHSGMIARNIPTACDMPPESVVFSGVSDSLFDRGDN